MAKLYYGNGECSIDGEGVNIRGVEIAYTGNAKFECKAGDNFTLFNNNSRVIIFPIGWGFLTNLFNYSGDFKITSVNVADENSSRVSTKINEVMDYAELLNTNAEDMTNHSEDLNSTYFNIKKNIKPNPIVENLDTAFPPTELYTEEDELYIGKYHIHKNTLKIMSGATHSKDSLNLHIKPKQHELNKQMRRKKSNILSKKNNRGRGY